ncbi:hypothetical protein JQ634_19175 [Bradyrhizobium sp. AUGA SZCCT0240]|uniref:hypothetical protein n=1 Tax=unclassified Bradyrhizobium TaxID=2631580 RepID=UPI001BA7787F|nr:MULTISPECIES: hypothetical protein [unclassified Bradyrhizobium]MBR1201054.1 hypothetical protein [Bradyrhizobium sp. AUGA SZCCT0158]MBR1241124.1 hypothetical protein [Bradyrhizobium sp. AUGA SZCCT0274]MBR1255818.1 hypothetical protein [Bradyrhizobium sp. AUGA SZCCT0240]
MRKLTLILAATACVGLAAPAGATERLLAGQVGPQVADLSGKSTIDEFSAKKQAKAKKKKSATSRSSWGG